MNRRVRDCFNNTPDEVEDQAVDMLFLEKQELVAKYDHDMEQCSRLSGEKSSVDKALWMLRTEMVCLFYQSLLFRIFYFTHYMHFIS